MEENNQDDKEIRVVKGFFISMMIAYVAVVIIATIHQIKHEEYNLDNFVFNFFGGLIVIPIFGVLGLIMEGIATLVKKIKERRRNNPIVSKELNPKWEDFKYNAKNALETASCFLAIAAVIGGVILVNNNEIAANIAGIISMTVVTIIGLVFLCTFCYAIWRLVRHLAPTKSKFEAIIISIVLFFLIIGFLLLIGYLCEEMEYHMPRVNDAHFDRI